MAAKFSNEALQKALDALPKDASAGAALVASVDTDGARAAARFVNTADGWQLSAYVEHQWQADTQAGVQVVKLWKRRAK